MMDKQMPNDLTAENALLGSFLIDSDSHSIIDSVEGEYFFTPTNKTIFEAIRKLKKESKKIDIITVTNEVARDNTKHWPYLVTTLTSNIASGIHASEYYYIILEHYIKREVIRLSDELTQSSYEHSDLEEIETRIFELKKFYETKIANDNFGDTLYNHAFISFENARKRMEDRQNNIRVGVNTGLGKLQEITGGWQPGELIYLAARPSMGKTAMAIFFGKQAAKEGKKVAFFSLEMSAQSITDRAILGETIIDPEKWRNGDINNSHLALYEDERERQKRMKFIIFDTSTLRISDVRMSIKNQNFDLVIIDYIQLMKSNVGDKFQNRNLELGLISHELKAIAKENNIPVIALSQLNRRLDATASKRPVLSDLRDSGELEQDADLVIFPFRPEFYDENEQPEIVELLLIKHRNGRTGIIKCKHNKYMNNFFDINDEFADIDSSDEKSF